MCGVYVSMCSSVGTQISAYTWCAWVCKPEVSVKCLSLELSMLLFTIIIMKVASHWFGVCWFSKTSWQSQESSCLCLLSARIAGTWHHSQILRKDLNTGPNACITSAFLTEPSPYSLYFLFWGESHCFPGCPWAHSVVKPWLFTLQKTRARKCPKQSRVGREQRWWWWGLEMHQSLAWSVL